MQVTASAPGKAILFGEHAVVYGKPAIAVAVNRFAHVNLSERSEDQVNGISEDQTVNFTGRSKDQTVNSTRRSKDQIYVEIPGLKVRGYLNLEDGNINSLNHSETGILKYILKSLQIIQKETPFSLNMDLNVTVELEMPVGSGLGSSAAVTVATIAAASKYYGLNFPYDKIAALAHQVELEVQGAASPIDTTLSTFGGMIYLSNNPQKIVQLPVNLELPLVIGHTIREGNTAELVESVRVKKENYPSIINPLLKSIQEITEEARKALMDKDEEKLGELMNINQGLLDALGINTEKLSQMIYLARENGALGSKITGAGGGGSIIAYCPEKLDEVLYALGSIEQAFPVELSQEGVKTKIKKN